MLTKETTIGKIEIIGDNIQVREDTIIYDDDIEISKSYHRLVYSKGDDLTNANERIIAIAKAIWI